VSQISQNHSPSKPIAHEKEWIAVGFDVVEVKELTFVEMMEL
jgi:hypothetical protein